MNGATMVGCAKIVGLAVVKTNQCGAILGDSVLTVRLLSLRTTQCGSLEN